MGRLTKADIESIKNTLEKLRTETMNTHGRISLIDDENIYEAINAVEKRAHYEDLEEQLMESAEIDIDSMVGEFMHDYKLKKENRMIELPCAVGDTVYIFGKFRHGIEEEKAKEFRITEDCIRVMADPWDGEICEAHQIGKTVKSSYETNGYYLSITEAAEAKQAWEEAKLAELEK